MASYIATLLNVEPDCNPEFAFVVVQAKSKAEAEKQADEALKEGIRGFDWWLGNGWSSYRDPELHTHTGGKPGRWVVDVVTEDAHVKRSGKGNTRGSENQADRERRLRKAAKD